jgi:hypothetical protein
MLKDKLCQLYGTENVEDDHTIAAGEGPYATELTQDIEARRRGHTDAYPPQQ